MQGMNWLSLAWEIGKAALCMGLCHSGIDPAMLFHLEVFDDVHVRRVKQPHALHVILNLAGKHLGEQSG